MTDFILNYDTLEGIARTSNSLGRQADEYANGLSGVTSAISGVTDSSSGYLVEANHSVMEKIGLLQEKAANFFYFSNQITSLAELAEQVDKEVEQLFAESQKNFLQHHKSLRIDRWKIALLNLFVDSKNKLPFLGVLSNMINTVHTTQETSKEALQNWYRNQAGKTKNTATTERIGAGPALNTSILLSNLPLATRLYGAGTLMGKGKIDATMGDGYDCELLKKDASFFENIKKGYKGFEGFMKSDEGRKFLANMQKKAYENELQVQTDKLMSNINGKLVYNWTNLKEFMQSGENMTEAKVQALITMYTTITKAEDIEKFVNCSCVYDWEESTAYFNVYKLSPMFIALANTYGEKMVYPLAENEIFNQNSKIDTKGPFYDFIIRQMSKAAILENIRDYGGFLSITGPNFDLDDKTIPSVIKITAECEIDTYDYTISNQTSNGFLPRIQVLGLRASIGLDYETDKITVAALSEYIYDDATKDKVDYIVDIVIGKFLEKIPSPISYIYGAGKVIFDTWGKQAHNIVINNSMDLTDFSNKAEAACISAVISINDRSFAINYSYCDEEELELRLECFNSDNITSIDYIKNLKENLKLNDKQIKSLNLDKGFTVDDILNGFDKE